MQPYFKFCGFKWVVMLQGHHACGDRAQLMASAPGRHRAGGRPPIQKKCRYSIII